jgi:hypothetical protein
MPSASPSVSETAADPAAGRVGGLLVMGLLLLGLTAATVAIAFQRGQTQRCLTFYGAEAAAAVSRAAHVELWQLRVADGRLIAGRREDISSAKGLVHLRRGLVEDANFDWQAASAAETTLPPGAWDWAMVFAESPDAALRGEATLLVIDLGDDQAAGSGGWISVVGQGGRVGLGRIGPGLAAWIGSTTRP